MQATGHLPFASMLWAGHLHGHLHVHPIAHQVRDSWKSQSWKSRAASAIDQASDWSLAIHFMLNKLVACSTKCGVCFNLDILISVHVMFLISLSFCPLLAIFNLLFARCSKFCKNKVIVSVFDIQLCLLILGEELALQPLVYSFELPGGCHPVS